MAFDGQGPMRDVLDMFKQWHEFCRATAKGLASTPDDELFVVRQVGHPSNRVLAVVDPDTRHVSVLGVGVYPQLRELHRLALHAFRSGIGDVLFPPLSVQLEGVETRFRYAGHASIFAFADTGAPPRSKERATVLAVLPGGFTLAAIQHKRALVIAQGRLSDIAGLDLDRMNIWDKLPATDYEVACLRSSDLMYVPATFSQRGKPDRVQQKSHGLPRTEDPARLEATLGAALQASIIEEIPIGTRGRRELSDFLIDVARLAVRGEPDITGSSREIAVRMGKALGRPPRSTRSTNTSLALLVEHGERRKGEAVVSRLTPHRWALHLRELVDDDGRVRGSLFSRWSALHAILVGDHETVSEDEVARTRIRGGLGGAVVKKRHEVPYFFDCGMVDEYNLRRQRESELMQLRVRHAEELRALAEELAEARQQRDRAIAENAQRAAQVAEADGRLDRLQRRFADELQRVTELAAQAGILDRNKAVVRALQEAVNRRDWPAVERLLAPGFVQHDPTDNRAPVTRAAFLSRLLLDAEQNPAAKEHVDFLVAEEDFVAVHLHHAADGPASTPCARSNGDVRIFRVTGGQIAEAWGWFLACPNRAANLAPAVDRGANEAAMQAREQAEGLEAPVEAGPPLRDC